MIASETFSSLDDTLHAIINRHCPRAQREPFTRIPVTLIQMCVAHVCCIKPGELLLHRRTHELAEPRQIAMYLARRLTGASSAQLGRVFHRDHSTVLYGYDSVAARMEQDPHFAQRVNEIEALVRSVHAELRELVSSQPSVERILAAA